ncbi:MAG TPA: RDD family protein [Gammaproteobacteria bacterium]|nr:RDD family protein [Gammaproteobacteria bacterium]
MYQPTADPDPSPPAAPVWRRLAAFCYDLLLIAALWFVATALLLPFTGGAAVSAGQLFYRLYLAAVVFLFYGWFWTHGGQTLGMRAWKIRLVHRDGGPVRWRDAARRGAVALLYLAPFCIASLPFLPVLDGRVYAALAVLPYLAGTGWARFDTTGLAWHDRLSRTKVVRT